MSTNKDLHSIYNSVYGKDERKHYTKFRLQQGALPQEYTAVLSLISWEEKTVLDAGCGTGDMCALVAEAGVKQVLGVDYSEKAIEEAQAKHSYPHLSFSTAKIEEMNGTFDVIMSLGTLEHMDNPFATLQQYRTMLAPGGSLILTCPNWLNPRGFVLQTLWHLFRAPITKVDLHYLTPLDFQEWAGKLGMNLKWQTVDHDWGSGQKMIRDFERRLPNVMRDASLPVTQEQINGFLKWLETRAVPFPHDREFEGAVGVYHLQADKE